MNECGPKGRARMNISQKARKYVEYVSIKLKTAVRQKRFQYEDITLKYMEYSEADSDVLLIVFSSCTRNGVKARYNYVRTLKDIRVNKLFILDDFAEDHRGSFYLGPDFKFTVEKATYELINSQVKDKNPSRLIFAGSSKGGWAALNFGLGYYGANIIIGAPQYYLGTYLNAPGNKALSFICGTITDQKITYLNQYLKSKIEKNPYIESQKVFIHYSNQEHMYKEHIKGLIGDLKKCRYSIVEDVKGYQEHNEVSAYFPIFLCNSIRNVLYKKDTLNIAQNKQEVLS